MRHDDDKRKRKRHKQKLPRGSSFLQGPVLHRGQVTAWSRNPIRGASRFSMGLGWGAWCRKGGLARLFFLGYGGSLEQVARISITKLFPGARLDWIRDHPCLSRPGMNEVPNRAAEACCCPLCPLVRSPTATGHHGHLASSTITPESGCQHVAIERRKTRPRSSGTCRPTLEALARHDSHSAQGEKGRQSCGSAVGPSPVRRIARR